MKPSQVKANQKRKSQGKRAKSTKSKS
jgi:hypothetical protein